MAFLAFRWGCSCHRVTESWRLLLFYLMSQSIEDMKRTKIVLKDANLGVLVVEPVPINRATRLLSIVALNIAMKDRIL